MSYLIRENLYKYKDCMILLMWGTRIVQFKVIEIARGWREERMRSYLMGIEFQFCEMKNALEMDGGDGCTTVRMSLTPLNCTLK